MLRRCRNLLKISNCARSMTLHCNRYSPSFGVFFKASFADCPQNELAVLTAADSTSSHASIIAAGVEKETRSSKRDEFAGTDGDFSFAIASTSAFSSDTSLENSSSNSLYFKRLSNGMSSTTGFRKRITNIIVATGQASALINSEKNFNTSI
ncbi:hypothetical protein SOD_c35270 [Serratia plymuthica 4Rx13]|nr:hypothetical protein SOD_c35270 [Serratia plymuthica 4Rx13]